MVQESLSTEDKRVPLRERREYMRNYMRQYIIKLKEDAHGSFGGICMFADRFCQGKLQIDHKYPQNRTKKIKGHCGCPMYRDVLRNPSKYMLLCQFHNRIKSNIPYEILLPVLESVVSTLRVIN